MLEQLLLPPLIAFVLVFCRWLIWGREKHGTIIPIYKPPNDMSVLECGILLDDTVNTKDISLELYNLQLQGILVKKNQDSIGLNPHLDPKKIETLTTGQAMVLKHLIGREYDIYIGEKTYKTDFENLLKKNKQIFSKYHVDFMYKSKLQDFSKRLNGLRFELYDFMTADGYFPENPFNQRKPYFTMGAIMLAGSLLLKISAIFDSDVSLIDKLISWPLVLGLSIAGIIIAYSSLFTVKKSLKGIKAKTTFLGLKEYIQTAELDRIKFVIQNNYNTYQSLLPYAALFNSLEHWLEPLNSINSELHKAEFRHIEDAISGMNVDLSITEKHHWMRSPYDLFIYGAEWISKLKRQ